MHRQSPDARLVGVAPDIRPEFTGRIRTPPRFELLAVAGDLATGVRRDQLGVEYLEQYEVTGG